MEKKLMLIAVLTALVVVTAFSSPAMAVRDLYQYSYDRCLPLFKDFESKAEVFTDFSEQCPSYKEQHR
jgi:hypothetical protein